MSLFVPFISIGQDRCSIDKYELLLNKKYPGRESKDSFEKWIRGHINHRKSGTAAVFAETYTIPVVVHVIHNGESVGTGTNISDAQIESQISVLNEDFRRLNPDAFKTPNDFLGVAGAMSVEFILAKRDPLGFSSNGIVRVDGDKSAWGLYEEGIFKGLSFWPSEDYLNIWVLNLSGSDIGYASFPVSNLPGMEDAVNNRLIDGVIIDYKVFGSKDYGNFDLDNRYNVGRTATHEIGHFLGLRHIWGDISGCGGTDYVDDTPAQNGATFDCPSTHPIISCNNTAKMYQNYMDYTQDACMNLFTKKQVERMVVVMENSPRRKSLTTSLGSVEPVYGVECSINILTPQASTCPGAVTPEIIIRNLGNQIVESVKIQISVNSILQPAELFSVSLIKGQSITLSFPQIQIPEGETISLAFELVEVNGSPDELSVNNFAAVTSTGSASVMLPVEENFSLFPDKWTIGNPDGLTSWAFSTVGNGSVFLNGFDYEQSGEVDVLFTPVFSTLTSEALLLQFDIAYARYPGNNNESLSVYVIEDCTENFSGGTLIFQKQGSSLASAPDSFSSFIPAAGQWRTENVVLNDFIGKPGLRLAFVFRNGYGNNFYLDELKLRNSLVTDLRVVKLSEPAPAVCLSQINPLVIISNSGTTIIEKISGVIRRTGGTQVPVPEQTINLAPGSTTSINLPAVSLNEGNNSLSIELFPVNSPDAVSVNNQLSATINRISVSDKIPARENFDGANRWTIVPTSDATLWETSNTNKGTSVSYQAFTNEAVGAAAWLVSPVMDMSKVSAASLFADFSYGIPANVAEQVILSASTDCGLTFNETIFEGSADQLSNTGTGGNFIPATENDWTRRFFDISQLAGQHKVLFSLIVTNNNGNNLFVDNIEFFADNNPEPKTIEDLFSVYRDENTKEEKITFNLTERGPVRFQMFSSAGLTVLDNTYDDILNQTLTLDLDLPSGLYIYRFLISGKYYAVRHFVP
ncbi:MAG: M43 family zinc metalloprotease [Cyclobacteriaceae bacterium]